MDLIAIFSDVYGVSWLELEIADNSEPVAL
jgi:hypothetical protein